MSKGIVRVEPKSEPLVSIEDELDELVADVNDNVPPAKPSRDLTAAERISEDFSKELIVNAQNLLTEAQNLLRDDELFAELVRNEVKMRCDRNLEFLERLHKLRADHETSRKAFQAGNGHHSSEAQRMNEGKHVEVHKPTC